MHFQGAVVPRQSFTALKEQMNHCVKDPNISVYFFFSAHHSMVFYSDVPYTGVGGVSDFSVVKYYQLNINYSVNILNECLPILINCSQLSKTYYNVLFSSSTEIVIQDDTYIGGRSENNINASCLTISGGRTEQLYIFCRATGFTSDFLSFIVVELIWFFRGAIQMLDAAAEFTTSANVLKVID